MRVVVTGAAGFLGGKLADHLLSDASPLPVSELVLTDREEPAPRADPRVRTLRLDLTAPGAAARLLPADALFHLAAVVSGHAEDDFDLGLAVNLDATRALLEATRALSPRARFVFASSVAVFGADDGGGGGGGVVGDDTAPRPRTSYGAAKAAAELLVLEYARRGFADARVARLPTVCVRGGAPNAAVTSYASAMVREPLRGCACTVPVPPRQELCVGSPRVVVRNVARLAALEGAALEASGGGGRCVLVPALRESAAGAAAALRAAAGGAVAARVHFAEEAAVARMVASFPVQFDNSRALRLGFEIDTSFVDIIKDYMRDECAQ